RRRHTRFSRDWSSDVCSSDLLFQKRGLEGADDFRLVGVDFLCLEKRLHRAGQHVLDLAVEVRETLEAEAGNGDEQQQHDRKGGGIGRASRREGAYSAVAGGGR